MTGNADIAAALPNEQGLARRLTASQQAMVAIGGAIGTGLFLGTGLSVGVAGPAVIVSYLIAAGIAMLVGIALTEMAVAHPTAGAFGVYAGMYVSPFAGYAVRISYWLMEVIATGGHLVAVSIYMQYWFPGVPGALWILAFSIALVYLNTRSVGLFGTFEYWLSLVKVVAIAFFVVLGVAMLLPLRGGPAPGLSNLYAHGGFAPFGVAGIWLGACLAIYSFVGVEIVGVTSGEAADPGRTIPRAMRRMVLILCLVYLVAVSVLVALVPWATVGVSESPFVMVLRRAGVPAAAAVMNLVVLIAALSSANASLYLIARTLFSLARAGFVPAVLGETSAKAAPVNALLVSSAGLAVAVLVRAVWPGSAYTVFFAVSLFGALFVWLMIFATHLAFRRHHARAGMPALPFSRPGSRAASVAGFATIAAVLASAWWVPGMRFTVLAGPPWLLALAVGYRFSAGSAVQVPPRSPHRGVEP
jgi:L-asparagine transporter-like permease